MGSGNSYSGYSDHADRMTSLSSDDELKRAQAVEDLRERNRRAREQIAKEAEAKTRAEIAARKAREEAARAQEATQRARSMKTDLAENEAIKAREEAARAEDAACFAESEARRSEVKVASRRVEDVYDASAVRTHITHPPVDAGRLTIWLIDNSGSNASVAQKFRQSSAYLLATLGAIDPKMAIAVSYFSDHCDGDRIRQDVDFVLPGIEGDRILCSTTRNVVGMSGGDDAEAHECVLWDICDVDFGSIPKDDRHLVLISDVGGHGMGHRSDYGCPRHRDWRDSVRRVNETFGTFGVVCSSAHESDARISRQFVAQNRALDHIDLTTIRSNEHRLGIVGNAALFLTARAIGHQVATAFLQTLYAKWLSEPLFGQGTDLQAREAIQRFVKYLGISEGSDEEHDLLDRIFAE